jgi:hypothetical protein
MNGIAAIRDQARRDVHREAAVPALYIVGDDEPVEVNVRVHRHGIALGGGDGRASMADVSPKIVFDRSEVSLPARNAIVSVSRGDAWMIGEADPADGEFIVVAASRVSVARAASLPVPLGGC